MTCPWNYEEDMWAAEESKLTYVAKRNLTEYYDMKIGETYYMEGGYIVTDGEGTEVA